MSYATRSNQTGRWPYLRMGMGATRGHGVGCGCVGCATGGLGELVTPDNRIYWSPGAIRAWLNQINEQIFATNTDIQERRVRIRANPNGTRFINDFNHLKSDWLTFNRDGTFAWMGALWQSTVVEAAQQYVNRYNALEVRYVAIVGSSPTVSYAPSEDEEPSVVRSVNYNLMAWSLIGVAGVVGLGYMLNNYSKVKMLGKLTFNGRRRRSR